GLVPECRKEDPSTSDASRPHDRVIAHALLLRGRITGLVEPAEDAGVITARHAVEGVPFLFAAPLGRKVAGRRVAVAFHMDCAELELRRICVANELRTEQNIDIPAPVIIM